MCIWLLLNIYCTINFKKLNNSYICSFIPNQKFLVYIVFTKGIIIFIALYIL